MLCTISGLPANDEKYLDKMKTTFTTLCPCSSFDFYFKLEHEKSKVPVQTFFSTLCSFKFSFKVVGTRVALDSLFITSSTKLLYFQQPVNKSIYE